MAHELGIDPKADDANSTGARYVDTDRFAIKTPFDECEQVVGFLGRLDEEKGIRDLEPVAARLPPDLTFRFVGTGTSATGSRPNWPTRTMRRPSR